MASIAGIDVVKGIDYDPDLSHLGTARMEAYNRQEWHMISIRAEASLLADGTRQTIRTAGVWNIESDSSDDHLREISEGELHDLVGVLEDLGFSTEQVLDAGYRDNSFRSAIWNLGFRDGRSLRAVLWAVVPDVADLKALEFDSKAN